MRSSFYNAANYAFATGAVWYASPSALGPQAVADTPAWGGLLVHYFQTTQPGGPDDPNPPVPVPLLIPTARPPKLYLPLVTRSNPLPPPTWVMLQSEDFEGAFPSGWTVFDNSGSQNSQYLWGKRACRPFAGGFSGWAVGGGASGSSLPCGSNYPNNADAWMVGGP